ncbi:hypothetical protein ACHQM5_026193 [Ranunculus cassubicifolius]
MVQITEEIRAKAEIVYGDEVAQQTTKLLLKEVGLPTGLLPLKDIIECGYVESTGFVWLKQKNRIEHKFEKVGRLSRYETEITAYVDKYRIKKLTGVKVRELLIWVSLSEIYMDDPSNGRITFKIPSGIYRTFPASAFENPEVKVMWDPETKELKEIKEGVVVNGGGGLLLAKQG